MASIIKKIKYSPRAPKKVIDRNEMACSYNKLSDF